MGEVVVQKLQRDRLQGPGDRGHLLEHVDAVAVLLDHPLEPADLTLDPAQALLDGLFVRCSSRVDLAMSASWHYLTPLGYKVKRKTAKTRQRRDER